MWWLVVLLTTPLWLVFVKLTSTAVVECSTSVASTINRKLGSRIPENASKCLTAQMYVLLCIFYIARLVASLDRKATRLYTKARRFYMMYRFKRREQEIIRNSTRVQLPLKKDEDSGSEDEEEMTLPLDEKHDENQSVLRDGE